MHDLPASDEDIAAFLAAFEAGTLPKERWTHGAHLLGGAWYVHQMGEDAALEHVRGCVQRFNVVVGGQNTPTSGYHETVTAFWIKLLSAFLQTKQPISRAEFATLAVAEYGDQKDIYRHYWDFDVVASTEARAQWMPPNLARIEATCSSPQ